MGALVLPVDPSPRETLQAARFYDNEVWRLDSDAMRSQMLEVIRGNAEIRPVKHLIDLDAPPVVPKYTRLTAHHNSTNGRILEWDSSKVKLATFSRGGYHRKQGVRIGAALQGTGALNANVLDYLLQHRNLIPAEWQDKYVHFFGTMYRDADGSPVVRYLFSWKGVSSWAYNRLDYLHGEKFPAAVLDQ